MELLKKSRSIYDKLQKDIITAELMSGLKISIRSADSMLTQWRFYSLGKKVVIVPALEKLFYIHNGLGEYNSGGLPTLLK